jgi:hypothetical protein
MRGCLRISLVWLRRSPVRSAEGFTSQVMHWNKPAGAVVNLIRHPLPVAARRCHGRTCGVNLRNYTDVLDDAGDITSKTLGDSCGHTTS